jgi:TonB-dependent SusC/RagA subfamily outer membrane receptor
MRLSTSSIAGIQQDILPGGVGMSASHRRGPVAILVTALFLGLGGCTHRGAEPFEPPRRSPANLVTADDIERHPTTATVEELLVRLVPGVQLQRRADGSIALQIMGLSSRRGGEPLFVVDGVPVKRYGGTIGINPRDISVMQVLKEGGATAQYGFRGANGVVVITTKNAVP